jgi:hypothetical protein
MLQRRPKLLLPTGGLLILGAQTIAHLKPPWHDLKLRVEFGEIGMRGLDIRSYAGNGCT